MRRLVPLIDQAPFIELDLDWPSHVFVVEELGTGRYLCKLVDGEFGVSCFETALRAERIVAEDLRPLKIHHVSFDEARAIAKGRPDPVVGVVFIPELGAPRLLYVK